MNWFEEEDGQDQVLAEALDQVELQLGGGTERNGINFDFIPYTDRRARRFGVHRRVFTTRISQVPPSTAVADNGGNIAQMLEDGLRRAVSRQVLNGDEDADDFLFVNMSSNRLHHSYQSHRVSVGEWQRNEEPVRRLFERLSGILNSNEQFEMDDSFHFEVTHVRNPGRGSGRKRLRLGTKHIQQMLKSKKSVIVIHNDDELCCARALVTVKAYRDKDVRYGDIRRGRPVQGKLARELHALAGVPEGPCGLKEIDLFQTALPDYQIVVVSVNHGYQIIYKGPMQEEEKQLILIKDDDHFHACTSIKGFFGNNYYCLRCERKYNDEDYRHHRCLGVKCFACHQTECQDQKSTKGSATVKCSLCGRFFFGDTCFDQHLRMNDQGEETEGNTVCTVYKKCNGCGKVLRGKQSKSHICGYSTCPCCHEYLNLYTHECFLQPIEDEEKKRKRKRRKRKRGQAAGLRTLEANDPDFDAEESFEPPPPPLFVYFDIEAQQEYGVHVANLLCAEKHDDDEQFVFEGKDCLEKFLDWVRELTLMEDGSDRERPVICVAHNFQGYDSYFVLDEFYKQKICPNQIVNGAKILSMEVDGVKFIDSMCFLQMALSGFTKAFGLKELKKGFFPHFFNTTENQEYVGEVPSQDYYDPQGMSKSRREEFEKWHKERREEGYVFDFQKELVSYCQSDVRLLKEGCMKFQEDFESLAKFNPMAQCITIASACNVYYRKMCLIEKTIASEPLRGWHGKGKSHSIASLEWLCWKEHCLRQNEPCSSRVENRIAHAGNKGEHLIFIGQRKVFVDGFDRESKKVYEFLGDFYHGSPVIFPDRHKRHPQLGEKTMQELYEDTMERLNVIENAGYEVEVIWEHEWKQLKREREDVREYVEQLELVDRMEPRDAFFGGRTNAVQLYRRIKEEEGEEIRYVDYTSLYPWVNKNCIYPVGHPAILTQPEVLDNANVSDYFGLMKCTVLPPRGLHFAILPYRCGGKLTFPLCRTCVENQLPLPISQRTYSCPHTETERALTGTWCTPELKVAESEGYVIVKIHEVWHFSRDSTDLFSGYINTFLKIKQEASGWPSNVGEDPNKRRTYVEAYKETEGIQLDAEKIEKNPGMRSLAKMMLNSFWGKFGQQGNKCKVETFTSPHAFYKLITSDDKDVHSIRVVNEDMVEVVYNNVAECESVQVNINIFVACFTTCWARLKLYEGLKQLESDQVLYFDTDSIVYAWKPVQPELPLGNYLGEFTNELESDDIIVEFAAAGPKNYGYRTKKGKVECKVRGFRLNARGQEQLNFEVLRDNVLKEIREPLGQARDIPVWNPHKIVRDNRNKRLLTETEIKRYQLVFDKRVLNPVTFMTLPYGFEGFEMTEEDESNMDTLMQL